MKAPEISPREIPKKYKEYDQLTVVKSKKEMEYVLARPSGFWYLGSPYRKYPQGIDMACRKVSMATGTMLKMGIRVMSPIAHSHSVTLDHPNLIDDDDIWLAINTEFMLASLGLVVFAMAGWNVSHGLLQEMDFNVEKQNPIVIVRPHVCGIEL